MLSRDMGSRPLGVILTARRAVFICGDTEAMVPWRMVPKGNKLCQMGSTEDVGNKYTILQLDRDCLVGAFHEKSGIGLVFEYGEP